MKSPVSSLLILLALAVTARADLTIVQQVGGAGPLAEVTMKIKGDKARIEASPEVTMIFDGKTGESISIMHSQKIAMRTSAAQAKAAAAAITGKVAAPNAEGAGAGKSKVRSTGKKETIDGYEAEEYVTETPSYKASYWIAKNYPQGDEIVKQLQSMTPQAFSTSALATPDFRDFPGLPIRTNVTMGDTKIVSTIKSVKTEPLPDSDFMVPAGYKEMKVPDMSRILNQKPASGAGKPAPSPEP
jgi:hypothetical protein